MKVIAQGLKQKKRSKGKIILTTTRTSRYQRRFSTSYKSVKALMKKSGYFSSKGFTNAGLSIECAYAIHFSKITRISQINYTHAKGQSTYFDNIL